MMIETRIAAYGAVNLVFVYFCYLNFVSQIFICASHWSQASHSFLQNRSERLQRLATR